MKDSTLPKVAVVILNYNTCDLLEKYLPWVESSTYGNRELWVVDNASADDSVDFVKSNYPDIKLLISDRNRGYAGGYNWALEQIESDYYILLNSDVRAEGGWIEPMVQLAEEDRTISAIQPKIRDDKHPDKFEYAGACGGFLDLWGYAFCRGRIFDYLEVDRGQYDDVSPVFWATGACLFVRSEAFHAAGGFDEDFFAHMEEIDLCWRMQALGNKVYVQPQSTVFHLGGGTLAEGSDRKFQLNFRNNLILLVKNDHRPFWWVSLLWRMVLDGVSALKFVLDGKPRMVGVILKAHGEFWKTLGKTREKRAVNKAQAVARPKLYNQSIVLKHFLSKVNRFSDL